MLNTRNNTNISYIKECYNLIVFIKTNERFDLEYVVNEYTVEGFPYLYVLKQVNNNSFYELYELQFFLRKSILLSSMDIKKSSIFMTSNIDPFERRLDFNGAQLKFSNWLLKLNDSEPDALKGTRLLDVVQKSLNFSIKWVNSENLGRFYENGTGTGILGHILHGKIDLGKKDQMFPEIKKKQVFN